MSYQPAARVGDDIAHTNAGMGMLMGVLAGAAVGAVLVAATVATGGLALVAAAGAAAGLVSAGGLGGMYIGEASMGPACGKFVSGAPNVLINGRPATFTFGSFAACSKDPGPIPLATGAATVRITIGLAGRKAEKLGCSALSVAQVSSNVLIGGASAQDPRVAIQPEVPAWAVTGLKVLGIAGLIATLPFSVATLGVAATLGGLALGFAGAAGGAAGGRWLGEKMGLSESGIRAMEVGGGFLGGMIGGAAGTKGAGALGNRYLPQAKTPFGQMLRSGNPRVPPGVPLKQSEFDRIRMTPPNARPENPRSYLGDRYVDNHLARFDDGASYLTPTKALDKYGRDNLGRADGVFTMPKAEMDGVIARTGGDIGKIETELGIPPGTWNKPGATLSRIDISDPRSLDLRMPNGREEGANGLWMPGGKLPGGGSEAVINQIPKGKFTETIIGGH